MTDKPSDSKNTLIGRSVDNGRYEITRLIGEGGMGKVFEARQVSMDRRVALKILRAQLATDEQLLARFQQEALSISRLRHPNTITIFDYGKTEDDLLFMSMELLGGQSLFNILKSEGRIELPRALRIMDQVAGAVAEAHQLGIVHRDLKPENIQIDHVGNDPDFAKVLDFGIAKILGGDGRNSEGKALTLAGSIFGTPHYMSPEQVHGHKVDHRTDIYSLGIILYEMIAGQPPFDGNTPMAVMMAQASKPLPNMREEVPDAEVSDGVLQLISDCCVKDRSKRLRTADDMLSRLRQLQLDMHQSSGIWSATGGSSGPPPINHLIDSQERRRQRVETAPIEGPPALTSGAHGVLSSDHAGQMATVPPDTMYRQTDPRIRPIPANRSPMKWLVAAVLAAATVAVIIAWPKDETPPASTGADERVQIDSRSIVYTLDSDPQGAEIFTDDGYRLGVTPHKEDRPRGAALTVSFKLDGYKVRTEAFSGSGFPEQGVTVKLEPLEEPKPVVVDAGAVEPPPPATVRIESEPPGARVFLGNESLGVTPFEWTVEGIDAETANLRFRLKGYKDKVETLTVAEAPETLSARLEKRRRTNPNRRTPIKPPKDDSKSGNPYEKL